MKESVDLNSDDVADDLYLPFARVVNDDYFHGGSSLQIKDSAHFNPSRDAAGGATVDAEARTAINELLARIRALGLIAT